MAQCFICHQASPFISQGLNLCHNCIKNSWEEALPLIRDAHQKSRKAFGLPLKVSAAQGGISCHLCINECKIAEDERGYCGLRKNDHGVFRGVTNRHGNLSWYHDPLPTNCVASWVCPGGTGAGYPLYAFRDGPEYGFKNLAVFFHGCSMNCLFCQNWHFRKLTLKPPKISINDLMAALDESTACICYFGGDPTPQLPYAIEAAKVALTKKKGGILRICWETNGTFHSSWVEEMTLLSAKTGGSIKFDLKAWDERVHLALTGTTKERTYKNFALVAERAKKRKEPPLLVASTLLIPGYIDEEEVRHIAQFIASLDRDIPYALLGFYPQFYMADLPPTPKDLAYRCLAVAEEEGLTRVHLGNVHLFS